MSAVLVGALAITGIGVGGASLVQRRTWLSPWNWHLAAAMLAALFSLAVWARGGALVDAGSGRCFGSPRPDRWRAAGCGAGQRVAAERGASTSSRE